MASVWRKGAGKRGLERAVGYPLCRQAGVHPHSEHRFPAPSSKGCCKPVPGVWSALTLRALVYDILPSTIAIFSYVIGPRKLSVNEQFFCWCSNSSKFVTNNSDYIRRLSYKSPCCTHQRDPSLIGFLASVDVKQQKLNTQRK